MWIYESGFNILILPPVFHYLLEHWILSYGYKEKGNPYSHIFVFLNKNLFVEIGLKILNLKYSIQLWPSNEHNGSRA